MAATATTLNLQTRLQKSLRFWARNYMRKSDTNHSLDEIEESLLFFGSFTNLFSESFKEEIHLLANSVFKSERIKPSWGPFYRRIFIKVLDWCVNGLNFESAKPDNDAELFYRLIALTYMQNSKVRTYGQKMLYCLLTKRNWNSKELTNGVLKSCRYNLTTSFFSLDYLISMLSFLDIPKRIRGAYLVHCIKPAFKNLNEFEKYYKGLSLISYQCKNPFYAFYTSLLAQGKKEYREVAQNTQKVNLGAQLNFQDAIAGFELTFLKDTVRIQEQISFRRYFVPEAYFSKLFNSKEPKELSAGEAYKFSEPPASSKAFGE